jgi:hypothetical protein
MRRLTTRPQAWWACIAAVAVAAAPAAADDLAAKLEPHVGSALDLVELGTGRRYVRPELAALVTKAEKVTGLKLRAEGEENVISVPLAAVVKIVAGRETVHEAEAKGKGAAQLRGRRAKEAYERQVAEAVARMQANGVEPWPLLTAAEHAAEVDALAAFVEKVRGEFPGLQVSRTHEFIVASDIPAPQLAPYVANLDRMHDFLCDLYAIPRGEPVWKGKCLVVAFLREQDFIAFEARFMKAQVQGAHGLCHQSSDGRVIMACHRGDDAAAFAHMLVHETSHGFNHRWMSPQVLPNWLNEGIAEWVGTQMVKNSDQVPLKEAAAVAFMRERGSLGPEFFTAQNIDAIQYGMASGMVKFLVARDARKFAELVRAIKEGTPIEKALQDAYRASLDDLVAVYGKAVGVPALKR